MNLSYFLREMENDTEHLHEQLKISTAVLEHNSWIPHPNKPDSSSYWNFTIHFIFPFSQRCTHSLFCMNLVTLIVEQNPTYQSESSEVSQPSCEYSHGTGMTNHHVH